MVNILVENAEVTDSARVDQDDKGEKPPLRKYGETS